MSHWSLTSVQLKLIKIVSRAWILDKMWVLEVANGKFRLNSHRRL